MASTIPYRAEADGTAAAEVQPKARAVPKSGFVVSPLYDSILFIGAPLIGLAAALAMLGGAGADVGGDSACLGAPFLCHVRSRSSLHHPTA